MTKSNKKNHKYSLSVFITRRQVPPVLKSTFIFRTLTPNNRETHLLFHYFPILTALLIQTGGTKGDYTSSFSHSV